MLRISLFAILAASVALAGCNQSRSRGGVRGPAFRVDAGPGTDPDDPDDTPGGGGGDTGGSGAGATHAFVLHILDVGRPDPSDSRVAPGFDLDGRASDESDPGGCYHPDFLSPAPEYLPGVDNQLGPLLSSVGSSVGSSVDVSGSIEESIASGELILLLRVSGVHDPRDDSSVEVELLEGSVPSGGAPVIDGFGRLALGQTFAVTRSYGVSPGSIAGGMVQAASGALALGLPGFAGTGGGSLTLRDARVRFHFEAYELTGGVLGGALSVEEVIAAWSSPDVPESLVRSVLEGQADLAPDAGGYCRDISAALVFEAIPAVFE